MTETKFTTGPWVVEEDWTTDRDINGHARGDKYIAGFDITSKDIPIITCEGISGSGPTERANAYLIAAAPELYEALQACLNFMENTESELGFSLESADQARAALAKARGE